MKPIATRHLERSAVKLFFALMVTAMVAFAGTSIINNQKQPAVQVTGVVTDAVCGITHGTKGSDAECTRVCVNMGTDFALGVGKRIYILKGHGADLYRFAGDRVIVKGEMIKPDTIAVESVLPSVVSTSRPR